MNRGTRDSHAAGQPAPVAEKTSASAGAATLSGRCLEPGFVVGTVRRQDLSLADFGDRRVPRNSVDGELNRLRRALDGAREDLEQLRATLRPRLPDQETRILDTHLALLGDSVFIADVESLIVGQQFALESAVARVVGDFERIFRLVRDEGLRRNAIDLRDVGLRVLRRVAAERAESDTGAQVSDTSAAAVERPILAAAELSVTDLFPGDGPPIAGVVVEGGELAAHAATFVRSLGIPALIGVEGLLDAVQEGQRAMLDAGGGLLVLDPDPRVGTALGAELPEPAGAAAAAPYDFASAAVDGEPLHVGASCGSVAEVRLARGEGLQEIALQRLELPFLMHSEPPSSGALLEHLESVLAAADGARVSFRLASFDASFELPFIELGDVPNPELGPRGLGLLLSAQALLTSQLEALLLAGTGAGAAAEGPCPLRLWLPFVRDLDQLHALRDAVIDTREALRKRGLVPHADLPTGVLLETPGSLLAIPDFAAEIDFAALSLDALQSLLLGLDRRDPRNAGAFQELHPYCLRSVAQAVQSAKAAGLELSVFGEALDASPAAREQLLGLGLRRFCVRTDRARELARQLGGADLDAARASALAASRAGGARSARAPIEGFRSGLGSAD